MKDYGPDALIQAAQERSGLSNDEFSQVLVDELYRKIRDSMNDREWETFLGCLHQVDVGKIKPETIQAFLEMIRNKYPTLTAFTIAEVIAETIDVGCQPQSILSFNAERLLYSLTNLIIVQRRIDMGIDPERAGSLTRQLDLVTHSTSSRIASRIPYFMCHGALPVPTKRRVPARESIDKLVFSESSYLQLANSAFSWQSSVFLEAAITRHIIFIGMSMSDSNVRRWLGWAHENRTREIAGLGRTGPSTHHYWIRRAPSTTAERSWIESSVAHLGIRLVWIPSWGDVGQALRTMVGLPMVRSAHKRPILA
ncbi:MAG: SIR2 family protein [Chloroflexota bacterium]|nr:SIR2 family protein [Chloroflexota bacterium]